MAAEYGLSPTTDAKLPPDPRRPTCRGNADHPLQLRHLLEQIQFPCGKRLIAAWATRHLTVPSNRRARLILAGRPGRWHRSNLRQVPGGQWPFSSVLPNPLIDPIPITVTQNDEAPPIEAAFGRIERPQVKLCENLGGHLLLEIALALLSDGPALDDAPRNPADYDIQFIRRVLPFLRHSGAVHRDQRGDGIWCVHDTRTSLPKPWKIPVYMIKTSAMLTGLRSRPSGRGRWARRAYNDPGMKARQAFQPAKTNRSGWKA